MIVQSGEIVFSEDGAMTVHGAVSARDIAIARHWAAIGKKDSRKGSSRPFSAKTE